MSPSLDTVVHLCHPSGRKGPLWGCVGVSKRRAYWPLFSLGVVFVAAAILGGGVKALGAELPLIDSLPRQLLLAVLGLAIMVASFFVAFRESERDENEPVPDLAGGPTQGAPSAGASSRPDRQTILFHETGASVDRQWSHPGAAGIDEAFSRISQITPDSLRVDKLVGPVSGEGLGNAGCLVLPVGPMGTTYLAEAEIEAVHDFVQAGGGLLVCGTSFGDQHHGANLSTLAARYAVTFNADVVMPRGASRDAARYEQAAGGATSEWTVVVSPRRGQEPVDPANVRPARRQGTRGMLQITEDVSVVKVVTCCSLRVGEDAVPLLWSSPPNTVFDVTYEGPNDPRIKVYAERPQAGSAPVMAASIRGKVVVVGAWKMFINGFIDDPECDNARLYENALSWLVSS